MPKVDCLVDGSLRRDEVLETHGLSASTRTVLYAPTWTPYSSLNALGEELVDTLGRAGYTVLVKLHVNSRDLREVNSGGIDWVGRLQPVLARHGGLLVNDSDASPWLVAADALITPNIANQDDDSDVQVMAAALVFARTGDEAYRLKARTAIAQAIGTEVGGETLALGRNLAIWRHSSEPMEPAAPVTSTTLPWRRAWTADSSRRIGWRPSRSSTATSRMWAARPRPWMMSPKLGIVLHGSPVRRQCCTIRDMASTEADGTAIRISSISCFAAIHGRSMPPPSTGTPSMSVPALWRLSSQKPTTL
jgi:hypothetical protein